MDFVVVIDPHEELLMHQKEQSDLWEELTSMPNRWREIKMVLYDIAEVQRGIRVLEEAIMLRDNTG